MDSKLFNSFYRECKKIDCDNLKLSDCRLIAIIDGLKVNSLIPLASASYAEADTLKKTSVSLDALKRIAFALYDDFSIIIEPVSKTDAEGKKYIAYKKIEKSDAIIFDKDAFTAKILKGDTRRATSASSTPSASSEANAKETKVITIVEKLSDYIKNNLKVTTEELAKLENEFMKILDSNI